MSSILAIESSCDETAVALVAEDGRILSETLASQIEVHRKYGGVVPEVASRGHFEVLDGLVRETLARAGEEAASIRKVAATCGPGLIGPLLVGSSYAEGFARGRGLPFVGVHHLRGHLASVLLEREEAFDGLTLRERAARSFPALVLLVSGGHTQILEVDAELRARRLADTADDAAGECFDKSAKLMHLPYPGGPAIERLAASLAPSELALAQSLRDALPRPRSAEGFSFSGLKTAIRLKLEKEPSLASAPAFAWAIQETIADTLLAGLKRARAAGQLPNLKRFVLCGGVAANARIRGVLGNWARSTGLEPRFPPLKHSTDNAAMIGAAAWIQAPELALREVAARIPVGLA